MAEFKVNKRKDRQLSLYPLKFEEAVKGFLEIKPKDKRQTTNGKKGVYIMGNLADDFNYYLQHQGELVDKYNGKYVVIKDSRVLGAFDSELEAINETTKKHKLGTFLVQKCEPGSESYTLTYHSRVALV